jgi:hypothetical protein
VGRVVNPPVFDHGASFARLDRLTISPQADSLPHKNVAHQNSWVTRSTSAMVGTPVEIFIRHASRA